MNGKKGEMKLMISFVERGQGNGLAKFYTDHHSKPGQKALALLYPIGNKGVDAFDLLGRRCHRLHQGMVNAYGSCPLHHIAHRSRTQSLGSVEDVGSRNGAGGDLLGIDVAMGVNGIEFILDHKDSLSKKSEGCRNGIATARIEIKRLW